MDPASLERLSVQTRSLVEISPPPLLRLFYWSIFLELFLESGIASPVYTEDALPEMTRLLGRRDLRLFDPAFAKQLRDLAAHPRLPGTESARAFRTEAERLPFHRDASADAPDSRAALRASVLLVLRGPSLWGRSPQFAIPALLRVSASRGLRDPGLIGWTAQKLGEDPIQTAAERALRAVVAPLGASRPLLSYEVHLDEPAWVLRGDSLGLALALLFHTFEAAARRRPSLCVDPGVVVTGAIEETGHVLAVSPDSIRSKVRTAAGAGFRTLVLPDANAADARDELDALRRRMPETAALELVPVKSLADVLSRQDLLRVPARPVNRLVQRPRVSRTWTVVALVFALAVAAFWFRSRPWLPDNTTVSVRPDSRDIVTVRLSGFPPKQRRWHIDGFVASTQLCDLRPLTRLALLVGTGPVGPRPAVLYCYDVSTHGLLWSRDFGSVPDLPESTKAATTMSIAEIAATDLDGDGRNEIVISAQANPLSPCFLHWLTADGTVRSMYAHRGYLFHFMTVDMNLDGRKELIVTGTSHSDELPYGQRATMVVLDADHFSAWPGDGPFSGSRRSAFDSSLACVIFPAITDYCRMTGTPGPYVSYCVVRSSKDAPRIILEVGARPTPGILVTLDQDFQPIRVMPEDDLRPLVARALESGVITHDFTTDDAMENYKRSIFRAR